MELKDLTLDHVLADDSHAAVLLEATMTLGDRSDTSQYVDVYRLSEGKATEHWHLPLDPNAEARFLAGRHLGHAERKRQHARVLPRTNQRSAGARSASSRRVLRAHVAHHALRCTSWQIRHHPEEVPRQLDRAERVLDRYEA